MEAEAEAAGGGARVERGVLWPGRASAWCAECARSAPRAHASCRCCAPRSASRAPAGACSRPRSSLRARTRHCSLFTVHSAFNQTALLAPAPALVQQVGLSQCSFNTVSQRASSLPVESESESESE